jgi:ribosome-binding protein aMBF1 (putative translation factor)
MPTRRSGRRSSREVERSFAGPIRASSKLPTEERPTHYAVKGGALKAARLAAGMSVEQVAARSGYSVGVVESMEASATYHTVSISRVASVIPGHDLSKIRKE